MKTEGAGPVWNDTVYGRRVGAGQLAGGGTSLRFFYEAGPCGCGVYRQLTALGHACTVVAPSLIPRRPGDRIKTDRRDARSLAKLFQQGELTPVWVPDQAQEAMCDQERCREDFKHAERRVRQRLNSFLQRQGRIYSGLSRWTQAHSGTVLYDNVPAGQG